MGIEASPENEANDEENGQKKGRQVCGGHRDIRHGLPRTRPVL